MVQISNQLMINSKDMPSLPEITAVQNLSICKTVKPSHAICVKKHLRLRLHLRIISSSFIKFRSKKLPKIAFSQGFRPRKRKVKQAAPASLQQGSILQTFLVVTDPAIQHNYLTKIEIAPFRQTEYEPGYKLM